MNIEIRVTETLIFEEVLEVMRSIYLMSGPEMQEFIINALEDILRNTHDVRGFLTDGT